MKYFRCVLVDSQMNSFETSLDVCVERRLCVFLLGRYTGVTGQKIYVLPFFNLSPATVFSRKRK